MGGPGNNHKTNWWGAEWLRKSWADRPAVFRLSSYKPRWSWLSIRRLTFAYVIFCSLVGGAFLYVCENDGTGAELSYTNALFVTASAIGQDGLYANNFAAMSTMGTVLLFFYMIIGNPVLLSTIPVVVRLFHFRRTSKALLRSTNNEHKETNKNKAQEDSVAAAARLHYSALKRIAVLVPCYYIGVHVFFIFMLGVYSVADEGVRSIIESYDVSVQWWPFFQTVSAFSQTGFSLVPNGLIPFNTYSYILIMLMFCSQLGDLFYPVALRVFLFGIRWALFWWPSESRIYQYLLDNPRRCYTLLLPWRETLYLTLGSLLIYSFEWSFFMGLEWNNALAGLSVWDKILNALFSITNARHTGYNSTNVGIWRLATVVIFIGSMYVSTSPVTYLVKRTQVQELPILGTKKQRKKTSFDQADKTQPKLNGGGGDDDDNDDNDNDNDDNDDDNDDNDDNGDNGDNGDNDDGKQAGQEMEAFAADQASPGLPNDPKASKLAHSNKSISVKENGEGDLEFTSSNDDQDTASHGDSDGNETAESSHSVFGDEDILLPKTPGIIQQTKEKLCQWPIMLFLVWVLICTAENDSINSDPVYYNPLLILFEIVSGFSGCGLSVGFPGVPWDLSGQFNTFSKLLIILCILVGRLRALPSADDKALAFIYDEDFKKTQHWQ